MSSNEKLKQLLNEWMNTRLVTSMTLCEFGSPVTSFLFADCGSACGTYKGKYRILIPTTYFRKQANGDEIVDITPIIKLLMNFGRELCLHMKYVGIVKGRIRITGAIEAHINADANYYGFDLDSTNFRHPRHQMGAHTLIRYLWMGSYRKILYHALNMKIDNPTWTAVECLVLAHYSYKTTEQPYDGYKGFAATQTNRANSTWDTTYTIKPATMGKVLNRLKGQSMLTGGMGSSSEGIMTSRLFTDSGELMKELTPAKVEAIFEKKDYATLRTIIKNSLPTEVSLLSA